MMGKMFIKAVVRTRASERQGGQEEEGLQLPLSVDRDSDSISHSIFQDTLLAVFCVVNKYSEKFHRR